MVFAVDVAVAVVVVVVVECFKVAMGASDVDALRCQRLTTIVLESGTRKSIKNFQLFAPSSFAASRSSSGIDR